MPLTATEEKKLITVVIPCYNHAQYLSKAIESVLNQTYPHTEIIVIDDGSTDNTRAIAAKYAGVRYVYQQNQGLSAARNKGVEHSKGEYILFLDADDWLYPRGLEVNAAYLQQMKELAFVSGLYDYVYIQENRIAAGGHTVKSDHYKRMLQGNYICMIATVLFRKKIFDEFVFDTTLTSCEDYDLYLKITLKYPVHHHSDKIAAYRIHKQNMSANIPWMLQNALTVVKRHQQTIADGTERFDYAASHRAWKNYYCKKLYKKLQSKQARPTTDNQLMLLKYSPKLYLKYLPALLSRGLKSLLKQHAPIPALRWLHKANYIKRFTPPVGNVNPGDFLRQSPFSTRFGYDRGGPVDRYYIEHFLAKEAGCIKGRILEIGDDTYTRQYGGSNVTQSDILHIDNTNPAATIIGDLSQAPDIPDNTFDCIILTQTLHLIYDFKAALATCYRILKPSGALLLTTPGITPIDQGIWKDTWYWSFTDKSVLRLLEDTFTGGTIKVNALGNVYTAAAFLYGMGLQELTIAQLDHQDPHYQVIITAKAVKG
ncbi:glycosyltransferase [Pontibacter fetidus]|uniref:Glycosyltransferase n=1 Tax=Pontibacter fetidus TaxID=2700082 RepID=A0A6B2H5V7_9BACT|nr:glycosyltransferase [Pontibacter fetidus]NDK54532.1 glycosyltransferase [Pontibacter fetidus]